MDYNKIYINSSNIIDNLESMYYKTDNIKLKNKILYEINKYKKLNEICLIKNPNIKESWSEFSENNKKSPKYAGPTYFELLTLIYFK